MLRPTPSLLSLCILSLIAACASGGHGSDRPEPVHVITGADVYEEARRREAKEGASDVVIGQYTWAFENGSTLAAKRLAEIHLHGYGGRAVDHVEAVRWLVRAADGGDAESRYNLGCMYHSGNGVEKSAATAAEHWRRAAELEFAAAQTNLGSLYFLGEGVAKDHAQSSGWFRRAAERGDAVGQLKLALAYQNGWGVGLDQAASLRWMHAAASQGEATAQYYMGAYCESGLGIGVDRIAAAHWFWRAAENGHGGARGDFQRIDRELRLEADAGGARGLCYRGFTLQGGLGVAADPAAAFVWFERAAGTKDPLGTFELARCYANGLGVERNAQRAVDTCAAAARLGHAAAQYELALVIENIDGYGAEPHGRAMAWLRAAAERGHPAARVHVELEPMFARALAGDREDQRGAGLAYAEGRLQRVNYAAARHWLQLAHAQGDQTASLALGRLLLAGGEAVTLLGTKTFAPDPLAAASALEAIASHGNTEARTLLARLYADHESPAYDLPRAIDWANLAAANGDFTSVPIVQAEVDRAGRAEHGARLARLRDTVASDPIPAPVCGFCGGAGIVVAARGHYVGSHYWGDTHTTCVQCNGTGLLYH